MGRGRVSKRKKLNRRQRQRRRDEMRGTYAHIIALIVKLHEAAGGADRLRRLTANMEIPVIQFVPAELGGDAQEGEYLEVWNRVREFLLARPDVQAEIAMLRSVMDGYERGDGAAMDHALSSWSLSDEAHGLKSVG